MESSRIWLRIESQTCTFDTEFLYTYICCVKRMCSFAPSRTVRLECTGFDSITLPQACLTETQWYMVYSLRASAVKNNDYFPNSINRLLFVRASAAGRRKGVVFQNEKDEGPTNLQCRQNSFFMGIKLGFTYEGSVTERVWKYASE
jgi:hypothetical protein